MRKLLNRDGGFTITEALIAQLVLIIGAISIWSLFVVASRLNAESEDRTIAANIAQHRMEKILNTPFRYITYEHPADVYTFDSEPQPQPGGKSPYWTLNSKGEWITSLPEGQYQISYPGPAGVDSDPLVVRLTVSWRGHVHEESSLSLDTLVAMTPGRF